MWKPLLAAACCMAIVACGAAKRQAASPASEAAGAPMPASPRDQITQLDAEIDKTSVELELPPATEPQIQATPAQPMSTVPSSEDPKCHPAKTEKCTSSCSFSDSICGNADKICTIAKNDLPGDTWAAKKCAKANATCESSRTKCCGCQ